MSVVAFLVVGSDGSSTLHGSSAGITTVLDRSTFLAARRHFDCILTGGRSATIEPYDKTPCPLVVISHSRPEVLSQNPKAHWWECQPSEGVARAKKEFGPDICVEGGINFLLTLLKGELIDELRLSITPVSGGENRIDITELLLHFDEISKTEQAETIFYTAKVNRAMRLR